MSTVELFESNQNLVFAAIKQHFGDFSKANRIAKINNMDLDDLIQIGQMVLWNLCIKFDPDREESFKAYVVKSIKWKISYELHTKGLPIKVNTYVSAEKRNSICFQSIDFHSNDGETENEFFVVAPTNVEQEVLVSVELEEVLSILDKEERFILIQKSLGLTEREISKAVGKSKTLVNRIKNNAIKKINPNHRPNRNFDKVLKFG